MRPLLILGFVLAANTAPLAASAQESAPAPTEVVAEPAAVPASAARAPLPPENASGLPQQAAPPRTLRAYWHVFVAFALAWALLFGYALVLGRRFGALEREVQRLERNRPQSG